jgi:CPA2 family monovalent cation:H+ antiporter-2
MHADFLSNLAVVLGVAAVTTALFQWARLPIVLGYLLAGMLIGPHVPVPLVADQETVHELADAGVILLLFSIGLEFSFRKLLRVGRTAGLVAVFQVAFMLWLGYVTGRLLGWSSRASFFMGAMIAISSTTIIAKAFEERRVAGALRELVLGVLIVEDLLGILILAGLATATHGGGVSTGQLLTTTLRLVGLLAGLVVAGMLVVPRAMRAVARLNRAETTLIAAIGICFAVSLLVRWMGYSVALGAFIAGSLVAESGEAGKIEPLVRPVRDIFAAIFFVAVGMLIEPKLIAEHWGAVAVIALLVVVGKLVGVGVGAFLVGSGLRTSIQAGMSLAQIGEFSFIIAAVGMSSKVTPDFFYPLAVAVSALTTLITPWLVRASEPVANYVDRKLPAPLQMFVGLYGTWIERLRTKRDGRPTDGSTRAMRWLVADVALLATVVICAGVFDHALTEWLEIDYRLSPRAAQIVVTGSAVGLAFPFVLGILRMVRSLSESWALQALPKPTAPNTPDLSLAPRRALIAAIHLGAALFVGLALLAITQPFISLAGALGGLGVVLLVTTVALWRSARNLQGHVRAGAEALAETLAREARSQDTHHGAPGGLMAGIGEPVTVEIARPIGKSLRELNLRGATGATVLAVRRGADTIVSPSADEVLQPGDTILLVGTTEAIDAARVLLNA